MTTIIDIDHETGDLTQYTSTVTDSGDLSVAAGAALAGTGYGLSLVLDDNVAIYGAKALVAGDTSGKLRWRFYIDPNGLTMANNDVFINTNAYGTSVAVAVANLLYTTVGGYQIRVDIYNDAGALTSANYAITDAPHYVEIYLIRATNSTSSDGSIQTWIDGASQGTISNIDNYDRFADFKTVYFGASGVDTGTRGVFYLDELIVNNDGSEIGPVSSATAVPVFMHHMQQQGMS